MKSARFLAIEILESVFYEGEFSNKRIQRSLDDSNLSDADRRLCRNIIYGVIERSITLDFWVKSLSSVKMNKIERKTLLILKTALYQIAFMDRIPDSAAVNEAVKLAKKLNFRSASFVNALLRAFIRLEGNYPKPNEKADKLEFLSVEYSHPTWLVERWLNQFGETMTRELMAADNEVPKLSLRCNTLKIDRETLMASLASEGYLAHGHELIDEAIVIDKMGEKPLHHLEAYEKGHFFVQDLSAMLVALISGVDSGETVLDMCAAPGGKSTHMAQLMGDHGTIISRDVNQKKIDLIRENILRLEMASIRSEIGDGLIFNENDIAKYDKLILDAPCSGLGIIRRKPEIRYNRKPEDIEALSEIQINLLENASKYVKVGGALIYSTCTIDELENSHVIEKFLSGHPEYEWAQMPEKFKALTTKGKEIKLYQNTQGFDGFYIAKLYRTK